MQFDPISSSEALLREYLNGSMTLRVAENGLRLTISSHSVGPQIEKIAHWMDELVGLSEFRSPKELEREENNLRAHVSDYLKSQPSTEVKG